MSQTQTDLPFSPTGEALAALVAGTAQGDRAAYGTLIEQMGPRLYGICVAALGDSPAAGDAVVASFETLVQHADAVPEPARLPRWMRQVARNQAVNLLRGPDSPAMALPHVPPDPEDMPQIDGPALAQAIAALPPAPAEALRRIWVRGDSYEQIAAYFELPLGGVRDWLRAAMDPLIEQGWRNPSEHEDPEYRVLAAEYALGVLTRDEASAIEELMALEPELEAMVAGWGRSFAHLADGVAATPLSPELRGRLLEEVPLPAPRRSFDREGLWEFVWPVLWGLGAAAVVLLMLRYLN